MPVKVFTARKTIPILAMGLSIFLGRQALGLTLGDLMVADSEGAGGRGEIVDINPKTGAQSVFASGGYLQQPAGLCLDPNLNSLIVADYGFPGNGQIIGINLSTGQQRLITSGNLLIHPTGVAVDSSGNLIVSQQGANQFTGSVLRINPSSGSQATVSTGGSLTVAEDVIVPSSTDYYVTNFQVPSAIIDVNSSTGNQGILATGGYLNNGPHELWLNTADQSLLVAQDNTSNRTASELLDISPAADSQNIVSSGGYLIQPVGVTQDSSGNTYVTDTSINGGTANVVLINLKDGSQTLISSGSDLDTPSGIIVVPEPCSALVGLMGITLLGIRPRSRRRHSGREI